MDREAERLGQLEAAGLDIDFHGGSSVTEQAGK